MPKQENVTDLKVLAVLGVFAYLLFIVLTVYLIKIGLSEIGDRAELQQMRERFNGASFLEDAPAHPDPVKPGGLGSEGSVCGGSNRLPCMPGLKCAVSTGESMGICAKVDLMDNQPVLQ